MLVFIVTEEFLANFGTFMTYTCRKDKLCSPENEGTASLSKGGIIWLILKIG